MSIRHRAFALILLVSLLAPGCGSVEPPATSALPTKTQTPVPPTATRTATATEKVPSATPAEIAPASTVVPANRPGYFGREALIEDTRQLASIIENTHPDPYTNGGGRIAFHRQLQRILEAIPEHGMTKMEYLRLI